MALIDHTNYSTLLKQSTNPRGSSPNGNIYFDKANDEIQLIGVDELATVDFGAGAVPNPLSNNGGDGITMRALYNFENQERRTDETLRNYKRGVKGSYRFAGAYNFVNGVKLNGTDRFKIRGSGFIEYADTNGGETDIDRVYHGVLSLNSIQSTTVSTRTLVTSTTEADLQSATWTDFNRTGAINEVIQVYGDTSFGDAGAGDFDYRTRILVVRTRSWGYNAGETTSVLTSISEFSGFSAGYGVGESINTQNTYDLADVYGGAQIAPWTGMSLEKLAVPQTENGFVEGSADFTWILHNTLGGTVKQCSAYLDALALQDADIDVGTGTYNGKKGRIWYTRDANGKVVTSSQSGEGLFIEGLSTSEKQNIIMTSDAEATRTYPFYPEVQVSVGAVAVSDVLCWYQAFYKDGAGSQDFDTATAVTVNDANGAPVKGYASVDAVANKIVFAYDYDGNTQAGLPAGVDKDIVFLVEGDGIAGQSFTEFTITRSPIIPVTCAPTADNNA